MKNFWHYIEGKRQDSIGIGTLKNQSGNIVTDPSEKAEILNNHFKSVLTIEDTTSIPDKSLPIHHRYRYYSKCEKSS